MTEPEPDVDDLSEVSEFVVPQDIASLASDDPDQAAPATDNGPRPEDGEPLAQPADGALAAEGELPRPDVIDLDAVQVPGARV